jgi:hypothetical protein
MIMCTSCSLEENHCFLMRNASCGYWLPGLVPRMLAPALLEIAEDGAAAGVEQRLDRGVRVLRRVMDLRHVVHGGDAIVELRESAVEFVDVDILRPVHRREFEQDEFEVGGVAARAAVGIADQDAVGEEAAQRRLELVMMSIDEAGHDDAPGGVDHRVGAGGEIRTDSEDLLALDQDIGAGEVAHLRVDRHHRTAADHVAPAGLAAALGRRVLRRGRARCKQIAAGRGNPGCGRSLEKLRRVPKWLCGFP